MRRGTVLMRKLRCMSVPSAEVAALIAGKNENVKHVMERVKLKDITMIPGTAEYRRAHKKVESERGKASSCLWECLSDFYEWANITGDYENVDDYASMCKLCHVRFDAAQVFDCKHGHPYDQANTYIDTKGHRRCRACRQASKRDHRSRKRAAGLAYK